MHDNMIGELKQERGKIYFKANLKILVGSARFLAWRCSLDVEQTS
jgi:hypothetical protein